MASPTPNIVFLHVDQLHHEALSALGNPHVCTPNMDEIMGAGTSMLRAQASYPLCCPARTTWFTGRMASETGVVYNDKPINPNLPDLGQWMTPRGYDCFYGGKWHVPARKVDSSFRVLYPQHHIGQWHDDACAAMSESFFNDHRGDKPFFLSIGLLNPHDCCYMGMGNDNPCMKFGMEGILADKLPPVPPSYDPSKPCGLDKAGAWNIERLRFYSYVYYRMAEMVDESVGRIFHALRNSRFANNTVFIFGADHGEMMGAKNKFGKTVLTDSSLRVPLTVVAPGRVPENQRNTKHITHGVDITATILDYAGIQPMPGMSMARSLRPVLENRETGWHDYVPAETTGGGIKVSFRAGDFKSIIDLKDDSQTEFYDTKNDPWEMKNLVSDSHYTHQMAEHRAYLADYQKRVTYCPEYVAMLNAPGSGRRK